MKNYALQVFAEFNKFRVDLRVRLLTEDNLVSWKSGQLKAFNRHLAHKGKANKLQAFKAGRQSLDFKNTQARLGQYALQAFV